MTDDVKITYPPGHYFSPIVDPKTVRDYVARYADTKPEQIAGIAFPLSSMREFWLAHLSDFEYEPALGRRYGITPLAYPTNDARTLRTVIAAHKPKQIIEIGSGGS